MQYFPDRSRFETLSRSANTVPVYFQLLSDRLTPVSSFTRLTGDSEQAFMLEGVIGGDNIARWYFFDSDRVSGFGAAGDDTGF